MSDLVRVIEEPVSFSCEGETLIGIVSAATQVRGTGVVIVVGGPQYRVGSHRQFVSLARHLAAAGFPTIRFDYRSMGDSTGERRTFEDIAPDIRAAIDCLLQRQPDLGSVVLWGLCDAASAAMMYASLDSRVSALALANPWVRSEETFAKAQLRHYYFKRLVSKDFWKKAVLGRLGLISSSVEFVRSAARAVKRPERRSDYREQMMVGLRDFRGSILLFVSGRDLTAREFVDFIRTHPLWQSGVKARVAQVDLADSDHTFSTSDSRLQVEESTSRWLKGDVVP